MSDFNFMPSLEIQSYGEKNPDPALAFDIAEISSVSENSYENGWYSSFPIDIEKLMQYIEPVVNYRIIEDGETYYISEPLKLCTVEDFERKGFEFGSEKIKNDATNRLCPNYEKMEYLKAKNGYINSSDRLSFSLEIYKCSHSNCKSDQEISNMLSHLMFNVFILSDDVEIGND